MFDDKTSVFAEEGTAAHELAELMLQYQLGELPEEDFTAKLQELQKGPHYSEAMYDYLEQYTTVVMERVNEARARTPDAQVLLEQRLDFSEWVPEGFGTGDVVIIADGILDVIDLKYGKGVPVSAEGNTQMRLYALGAISQFGILYEFDRIRMTIIQPRLDSVSTDDMQVDELLRWADEVVRPGAELAATGRGKTVAGDHCTFCKAESHCRARAFYALDLEKYNRRDSDLLNSEEIADVLERVGPLVAWAQKVEKYALDQALNHGVHFPRWKVVEGISRRQYSDREAVAQTLILEGFEESQIYAPQEILKIGDMEKTLGKKRFAELLGSYIIKPAGKPVLVPESDKRPELSSAASAAVDFEDS
ncbi:hypothetical protein J31TS4_16100 [Paenibacillus sp. J31TS4]|nr:hypothetical protein J31TS4_16100 [Paenibacillus sp. J31TS4]